MFGFQIQSWMFLISGLELTSCKPEKKVLQVSNAQSGVNATILVFKLCPCPQKLYFRLFRQGVCSRYCCLCSISVDTAFRKKMLATPGTVLCLCIYELNARLPEMNVLLEV